MALGNILQHLGGCDCFCLKRSEMQVTFENGHKFHFACSLTASLYLSEVAKGSKIFGGKGLELLQGVLIEHVLLLILPKYGGSSGAQPVPLPPPVPPVPTALSID